jgi:predicted nucleic acid-binding protein
MTKILLDTDVVINILKKKEETISKLASLKECEFYISPIVIAEIYAGAKQKEIKQIEELFRYFKSVTINDDIGIITGKYAKEFKKAFSGISLEDFMIASIAKYYSLALWTYNKKHYPMKDLIFI